MQATISGVVRNNVIVADEDITRYEGLKAIITFSGVPKKRTRKKLDFDSYTAPSERGQRVEEYMKEMRDDDRL